MRLAWQSYIFVIWPGLYLKAHLTTNPKSIMFNNLVDFRVNTDDHKPILLGHMLFSVVWVYMKGLQGTWGTRQGTPWTGAQPIAGHNHTQIHT